MFRASCDAVFAQRQQQSVEFKAELNTHKAAAETLTQEVKTLTQLSGKELLDARARVTECKREFSAVGNLPKTAAVALNQHFHSAITAFDTAIGNQLTLAKAQLWENLFTASDMIRLSQISTDATESDNLLQQAKDFIDGVEQWPKNGRQGLDDKIALGRSSSSTDDHQKALKLLCIRAEILVDQDTPAEDKALRMEYQVSRLQQGFGQNSSSNGVSIQDLILEWIASGPKTNSMHRENKAVNLKSVNRKRKSQETNHKKQPMRKLLCPI